MIFVSIYVDRNFQANRVNIKENEISGKRIDLRLRGVQIYKVLSASFLRPASKNPGFWTQVTVYIRLLLI